MFFFFQFIQKRLLFLLSTRDESRQKGFALEQLYNLPSNRLEEVQHLIRKGDEVQEPAEAFQALELWVFLRQRHNSMLLQRKAIAAR